MSLSRILSKLRSAALGNLLNSASINEATSSLDSQAEGEVQIALEELMKGRTTFIIAHRLSTIKKAHRIIVLSEGKITEEGTHSELLARKGDYHKLYTTQFHGDDKTRQSDYLSPAEAP